MRINVALMLTAFLGCVATYLPMNKYKETMPQIVPPDSIRYFSFGFDDAIADSLWLRLIQDFTFCEKGVQRVDQQDNQRVGPTLEEKVANHGMSFFDALAEEKVAVGCDMGWGYQMLDRITDLSPRFLIAYRIGATILSVLVEDRAGAAAILDKGLKQYPDDWQLAYRAAYHYLYEMRDLSKAADMLHLAGKNGAPDWVNNLASKLYERTGQLLMGRVVILELLERAKDKPALYQKAQNQLEKIDLLLEKEKRKKAAVQNFEKPQEK